MCFHKTLTTLLSKIGGFLRLAGILLVGGCLLSLLVTHQLTGKATIFGFRPLIIVSGSMEPTIPTGSIVIGVPVDAEDVRVGDIVAYRRNAASQDGHIHLSLLVVHRVRAITPDGYHFRGDHEILEDPVVLPEQICYRVVWVPAPR